MSTRRWQRWITAVAGSAGILAAGCAGSSSESEDPAGFPAGLPIARVSVGPGGTEGNGDSLTSSISADGRYVAFASDAGNLAGVDTNLRFDVLVRDRQAGSIERVSVSSAGTDADSDSIFPSISADGRFVAFESDAANLVSGDSNGRRDIFVHDRQTGTTERVSVASAGGQANGHSYGASISADGRFVAFSSSADNLVPGDGNGVMDVFVYDRQSGSIERASVDSAGAEGNDFSETPAIGADGRYVAFRSAASNLASGDSGSWTDIFVRDRQSGATERVSVASGGEQADGNSYAPAISADGRYVAFVSAASNLAAGDTNGYEDVFVHDRQTGTTERVNLGYGGAEADAASYAPAISADGRFVAFCTPATNLVVGDDNGRDDVFVHDRQAGGIKRLSVSAGGTQGDGDSYGPKISADGRYVAFESGASNLVSGDTNGAWDVFAAPNP